MDAPDRPLIALDDTESIKSPHEMKNGFSDFSRSTQNHIIFDDRFKIQQSYPPPMLMREDPNWRSPQKAKNSRFQVYKFYQKSKLIEILVQKLKFG